VTRFSRTFKVNSTLHAGYEKSSESGTVLDILGQLAGIVAIQ